MRSWGKHREGDPKGWSTVLVTVLGSWGKRREGDPDGWTTLLVTALGSWEKHRERHKTPKGWSMVLDTALGSWRKSVPRGQRERHFGRSQLIKQGHNSVKPGTLGHKLLHCKLWLGFTGAEGGLNKV